MKTAQHIILASASPRRRELLAREEVDFEVVISNADETVPPGLDAPHAAQHTARAKAQAVLASAPDGSLVIGADTIVVLDERIFGKPSNEEHAIEMLAELSGRTHEVITGVCLATHERAETFAETTYVHFKTLSADEISAYVATGEPMDKAGAYGIQGKGGALVESIEGDFDNVVGLPVTALMQQLRVWDSMPVKPL